MFLKGWSESPAAQDLMPEIKRPTKKQRELLSYIEKFVVEHGYGPSYREIMTGCNYTSVATVALHVNNLISRGHLQKNGRSARSLEIVDRPEKPTASSQGLVKPSEEKWLVQKIEQRFIEVEKLQTPNQADIDSLYVLVGALKVLDLAGAANSFINRLAELKKKL
jgi:SOS-response transcriptional repressor LexA